MKWYLKVPPETRERAPGSAQPRETGIGGKRRTPEGQNELQEGGRARRAKECGGEEREGGGERAGVGAGVGTGV
eukprot:scaffold141989_cov28-Tisochrysis_lutea.AAC.2